MLKFIIVLFVAWLLGVFGWSQIIGSLQNIIYKRSLLLTLILWIVIMAAGAYAAIIVFDSKYPLIIGYVISFIQVRASGKIS